MERSVGGERATTFEEAVLPHLDAAYTLARYLLRDEEIARDAVQDAALRALKYFSSFRGDDARGWWMAIVRNACHDQQRRHRPESETTSFEDERHSPTDDADTGTPVSLDSISAASVRTAVTNLPLEFREVVILRDVHGYSYKEIATIVGVPPGTVMSRIARGRQRLRDSLTPPTGGGRAR
jgi:RNA polymerase sigma-70 factor (ECF subfamily)